MLTSCVFQVLQPNLPLMRRALVSRKSSPSHSATNDIQLQVVGDRQLRITGGSHTTREKLQTPPKLVDKEQQPTPRSTRVLQAHMALVWSKGRTRLDRAWQCKVLHGGQEGS